MKTLPHSQPPPIIQCLRQPGAAARTAIAFASSNRPAPPILGPRTRFVLALLAVLIPLLAGLPVLAADLVEEKAALRSAQDAAVELARAGDTANALARLQELRAQHPKNLSLQHDQIVVLFWAEDFTAVLAQAETLAPAATPAYVASAVARSARNVQSFEIAARWYEAARAREPENADLTLGHAMALADLGEARRARDLWLTLPSAAQTSIAGQLTSAYLHRLDQAYVPALTDYDAVLALDPEQVEALRGKILTLQRLLLPRQALSVADDHPGLISARERERLEADALALDLRDALYAPDRRYPFPKVREALEAIDARLSSVNTDSPLGRQLRYDRIVGLFAMNRWQVVVDEYELLLDSGPVPAFVHQTAGDAFLALENPEAAEAALQAGLALQPDDIELTLSLFFALVEQERFEEAFAAIDGVIARQPAGLQADQEAVLQPNPTYTRARVFGSVGRAYADQNQDAIERLNAVLAEAPGSRQALVELANVYRWRGLFDQAEALYRIARTGNPEEDLAATYGLGHNQLARQHYHELRRSMRQLSPPYLTYASFDDLYIAWSNHFRSQILFDVRYGRASGNTFGAKQYEANLWWFSYPWRLNTRFYVRTFDAWAEFPEGNHDRRRLAGGVEYRRDRWRLIGELSGDRLDFETPGARLQADYRITDRWLLGAEADFASYATQLRADRVGITSDRYTTRARYRRNELWEVGGDLSFQPYDDGNDVVDASLFGSYRLINGYRYKLDVYGSLDALTSSLDDVAYFSPERAFGAAVGLRNTWRQFRRYQRSLTHRFSADVGVFDQKNFGSDPTWTLDYELEWRLSERLALLGGVQLNRRVYNANEEDAWFVRFGLDGRIGR
ncbi:MAG: poly-beta-1,6 N-acetyl-D-glucosamine export porin PgaA [Pseudomonadota bacterium]